VRVTGGPTAEYASDRTKDEAAAKLLEEFAVVVTAIEAARGTFTNERAVITTARSAASAALGAPIRACLMRATVRYRRSQDGVEKKS
jgi:hypothetical protein